MITCRMVGDHITRSVVLWGCVTRMYVYCVSESRLEGCSSIEVSGWD